MDGSGHDEKKRVLGVVCLAAEGREGGRIGVLGWAYKALHTSSGLRVLRHMALFVFLFSGYFLDAFRSLSMPTGVDGVEWLIDHHRVYGASYFFSSSSLLFFFFSSFLLLLLVLFFFFLTYVSCILFYLLTVHLYLARASFCGGGMGDWMRRGCMRVSGCG